MMRSWLPLARKTFLGRAARRTRQRPRPVLWLEALEDRLQPSAPGVLDPGTLALQQIDHFVVIYQENWSFDGLYSQFPGANTGPTGPAAPPGTSVTQVDKFGNPLTSLPTPSTDPSVPGVAGLPVKTYDLSQYVSPSDKTGDIVHRFYTEQLQIDNGKVDATSSTYGNDKFVTWSDNKSLVLSQFDATNLPEGLLAQQYTMDDNFFHAAYGGSFLNHQWLVAAATPQWNQPIPSGFLSTYDPVTRTLKDGNLTFDGKYAVNTTFSTNLVPNFVTPGAATLLNSINDSNPADPSRPFEQNIGDLLSGAGVGWKWYSGGWDAAVNLQRAYQSGDPAQIAAAQAPFNDPANPLNLFQWHHQPLAYFDNYAPLSAGGQAHLRDETRFFQDLAAGDLPAVSFIKPLGPDNEHPGYASLLRGQQHVADIVHAIQNSPEWEHTAIIITYDENGGRWDHVSPPNNNGPWGDGTRVPAIVISPFAKQGFVDHTQHDTLSILRTIEQRYGLGSLNQYDANATSLANDFQLKPHASIGSAYVQPDADNPGQFALIVQGTEASDDIRITRDGGAIRVRIDGGGGHYDHFFSQPISRLEVYGMGGSDHISVADDVTVPAFLFGGDGNDHIDAGGGASVVVGGGGNDEVQGGPGPSIVIGGSGHDQLRADVGAAILIGGDTAFDANLAALKALGAEWSRTDLTGTPQSVYQRKVADLTFGGAGARNGTFLLNSTTVHEDGARDELRGGKALDLFFARLGKHHGDDLDGVEAGEQVFAV
jgi:phospholipase C